ncbi:hypothetical protein [uncultured Bacteroides sp.]|uniref:hypothetical protein n=1 Tax=uncultured Bacteroides sp. TaxID=162156 RepID=UPI00263529EE|nr:hypothetical protein [uncultured Bacteroides sp.]
MKMKTEDIKRLLERYYNGETGEAEEKTLRTFFAAETVPQELEADQELFRQLDALARQTPPVLPEGLEERLSAQIDCWERQEKPAARPQTHRLNPFARYAATGIAAAVLLAAGIGIFRETDNGPKDTFDDPREAYAETQKALQLFAKALDKGTRQMEKVKTTTQEIQEKIDNIQKLRQ